MRPWAKWCVKHNMKWVLYLVLIIGAPLYLFSYIIDAYNDWIRDLKGIMDYKPD